MFRLNSKEKKQNTEMISRALYVPQPEMKQEKAPPLSNSLIETRLASLYNLLAKIMQNNYSFSSSNAPLIMRSIAKQYSYKESLNQLLVIGGFLSKKSALYKNFLTSSFFDPTLIKAKTSPILTYADKAYGYIIIEKNHLFVSVLQNMKKFIEDWAVKKDCQEIYVVFSSPYYKIFYLYTSREWKMLDLKGYDPEIIESRISTSDFSKSHSTENAIARSVLCSEDDFRETQKALEKGNLITTLACFDKLLSQLSSSERLVEYLMQIAEFGKLATNNLGFDISHHVHKPSPQDDDIIRLEAIQAGITILQSIAVYYGYRLPEASTSLNSLVNYIDTKQAYRTACREKKPLRWAF
ncbi:MAG TPA: hypothetical protein VLI69_07840 [Gammaproteobacteria bacterium]|nr:hypothetical protein [Gammaproteobacteria bacterium]